MMQVNIPTSAIIEIAKPAEESSAYDTYLCRKPRKALYLVSGLGESFYANGFDELTKKTSERRAPKSPWYKRIFGA